MAGGNVHLKNLSKSFDDVVAVDDVSVEIHAGEFFSLLGPSGCGKTTTLRLIAGFERLTSGRIDIDGEDMAMTPPHLRPVNTVFQNYALFPHMSVSENVAFGLRYQDIDKTETGRRVGEALELVQMEALAERSPAQLSGGQQQRVALARSLILRPRVLLLDEPLGALDAKLRKSLQIELKGLQEHLGITFIYVTHDQEEALTMSDRLAVMHAGRVAQVGAPEEVYERPASAYIADFLGVSNLLPVKIVGREADGVTIELGEWTLRCGANGSLSDRGHSISIRPERVKLCEPGAGLPNVVTGQVDRVVYAGPSKHVLVTLGDAGTIQVDVQNSGVDLALDAGSIVGVSLPPEALLLLDQMSSLERASVADSPPPSLLE